MNHRRSPSRSLPWALLFLLLPAVTSDAAAPWWDDAWSCRRTVKVSPAGRGRPGEEAALVEFTTGGYLRPDGGDLRVFAGPQLIPHKLLFVGPGDRVSLMFPVQPGRAQYDVYYGNPKAKPIEHGWEPERGLILEIRPYRGGSADDWHGMQNVLERAGTPMGRGVVDRVWHGHNPFGPSRHIVSRYTGWLDIPTGGTYYFATTSASASFLLLDENLVVQWPGWHGAVADARHHRKLTLQKGLHRFEYYHLQGNADPIMVAAWQPPGRSKPEVIPAVAFLPPLKTDASELALRGRRFAPSFDWENAGESEFTDHWAVFMRFSDTSFPRTGVTARREWDFGDGVTSTEIRPRHAYLTVGPYTVTLRVFRGEDVFECRQTVVADRDWANQLRPQIEEPVNVARAVKDYPWETLDVRCLLGAVLLCREIERMDEMLALGNLLTTRWKELPEAELVTAAIAVGEAYRDHAREADVAQRIFNAAEELLKHPDHKARMAVLSGDMLFYHLDRPGEADRVYARAAGQYPDATEYVRLALMRRGDVARRLGQFEEARRLYESALSHGNEASPAREAMEQALRALESEEYLRRGELDAAEESLNLWQWQDPMAKLQGQWSACRVRLALERNNIAEAVKEGETLLRVNPESQSAPEILLLLSRAEREAGRVAEARQMLERLKRDYPDSPVLPEAERAIVELGGGEPD